jgi:hypothetical protein
MKLIGKILVGFAIFIILVLVGAAIYIDLPVFATADDFSNYINTYNNVSYGLDNKIKEINSFNRDSLISKKINELEVKGEEVIVSYFRYKDPFTARSSIKQYQELNKGNFRINTMEINIPFYGKYWIQTSQGITNISWTKNKRVILIRSSSRSIAKTVENDIKSYIK